MSDYIYNYNETSIQLLEEDEGLLSEEEWINFDKAIKYGNLKESLGETFNMAQCLDNQMCSQYITGTSPPNEYNIKGIHLPDLKPPPIHMFSWYSDLTNKMSV